MSSVYFEQFEHLWKKVEEKFISENGDSFTLDNLRKQLIAQNILADQTNLKAIETKFLQYVNLAKKPPDVNLSNTIFNALFKYLQIRGISDLSGNVNRNKPVEELLIEGSKKAANKIPASHNSFTEIGFLGRESELSELEDFLLSPESRIFALYGVPMIGKTKLVSHYLKNSETAKAYKVITVKLNPKPENAEQKIKNEIFGDKEFNDFSGFSSNTLIVIQNFEETLKWTGNLRELHDLLDKYPNIKTFLEKAAEISSIKIILESRFQISFKAFLNDWRTKVKILSDVQLEGIEKNEFWQFYKSKGFSYEQFEKLCANFDNHTGLLALAYNNVESIYQSKLIEAWYQPDLTTRVLWELIEKIIDRLENHEIWLLCALTFLQEPVKKENLYEDFLTLKDFEDEFQIGDSFNSLVNKLLVQLDKGHYDLNPYIREVCYTFLKIRRRSQMLKIQNLPYFKEYGKTPFYDEIRQAREREDYLFFLRKGQKLRKESNYEEAIKVFESSLDVNPKKEVVLTEIAITYKEKKEFHKAIEILEEAKKINPNDVMTLDELAICNRKTGQLLLAIKLLERAREIKPNNHQTLNELVICYSLAKKYLDSIEIAKELIKIKDYIGYTVLATTYQEMGEIETAYQFAEEGMKTSGWDKSKLVRKHRELEKLISERQKESKQIINNQVGKNDVMKKSEILFLAANPQGSTLRLDQEMREVENQLLRVAKYRDNFAFNKEVATRIVDLQQRLLDEPPDFVHFSGHGSDSGIYLTDNNGNYQLVRGKALANLFNLFSDRIKCVFLNSCYSENQAKEINKFIPFVIGMKKAVPDDVAIQFAVSFYQTVASGREIEFAFEMAKNSVDLHNIVGSDIPVLLKK